MFITSVTAVARVPLLSLDEVEAVSITPVVSPTEDLCDIIAFKLVVLLVLVAVGLFEVAVFTFMGLGGTVDGPLVLILFVMRLLATPTIILVKETLTELVLGLVSNVMAGLDVAFVVATLFVVTEVVLITVTISIVNISVIFMDRIQSTK